MAGEHWFGIELRHLAALEAVAREGSFRRAAERLGYVQSAISHQIAALESLTGRRLIERSRGTRPTALTPAGEVLLARGVQKEKEGTAGDPFDITDEAWLADYADPYDFVNVLLDGDNIQDANNNNTSYFDDATYNKRIEQAALLTGAKRYTTYGRLDADIMKNAVPWAPRSNGNSRVFLSGHVGCFTYNSIYSVDLAALCKK